MPSNSPIELHQLREILVAAIDDLSAIVGHKSPDGAWPTLNRPPHLEAWDPHTDQEAQRICNVIIAAAYQLICLVRHPFLTLADAAGGFLLTAALSTANELNVAEVLHETGPEGMDIVDLATQCGADSDKLGRCLRALATHHIFQEVRPGVFAHNQVSSLLDTGISHKKLKQSQLNKYTTSTSSCDISGYVGHFAEEVMRASIYHLDDCKSSSSDSNHQTRAAFQKAHNTDGNLFAWMHDPVHKYEFTRHNACIRATSRWDPPDSLLKGFDWASLSSGSVVVDVGGGTGKPTLTLARTFPHLRINIQDHELVVRKGIEYWKENYVEALAEQRVSFTAHDFFSPQPILGAQVYFVRLVCHDWDDAHVIQIIRHLRIAASDESRLVVADYITPFASRNELPEPSRIKIIRPSSVPPAPLLSNLGKASANTYFVDLAMQLLLNGKERTLPQHIHVIEEGGWRVVEARFAANSNFGFIIAEPA